MTRTNLGRRAARGVALAIGLSMVACKAQADRTDMVDPAALRPGPVRHTSLSPAQVARIEAVQRTFAEVDPTPLEKWLDDFKRDAHPDSEIAIYESMATAYTAYCEHRTTTLAVRREVYALVLARSGAPAEAVLQSAKLTQLGPDEAREVLRGYPTAPSPITVEKR